MENPDRDLSAVDGVLQKISHNVQKIGQLANELDNLNQNIILSGYSKVKVELVNRKEKQAIKLIEETGLKFSELAHDVILEQTTTIRAERLKNEFKRSLQRFQKTQDEMKRRIATESRQRGPPTADLLGLGLPDHDQSTGDDALLFETAPSQQQLQVDAQELGYVLQQEEQMQAIEEDIVNVNAIFAQLSTLVYDQRTAVESLEDNVESAYINQEAGTEQLVKAANSRQRSRKRCCICSVVLTVILGIVILVLVLVYAPGSNH